MAPTKATVGKSKKNKKEVAIMSPMRAAVGKSKKKQKEVAIMSPTRAAVGKSKKKQKEVDVCRSNKFLSDNSAERYENLIERQIVSERKLDVSGQQLDEMAKQIFVRGWQYFISYPEVAYEELVREFYANVTCPNNEVHKAVSWIRGIEVPFNFEVIDRILKLQAAEGPYVQDDMHCDEILKLICIEGSSWNLDTKGEPINVKYKTLKPLPKVWATFLVFNVFPNTHRSDVKLDRAQTIYRIMTGRRVNIGEIIAKEIVTIVKSKSLALGYPYLITLLCQDAGVKLDEFSRMGKPYVINLRHAINFCGIESDTPTKARKRQKARDCACKQKNMSTCIEGESSVASSRTDQLLENVISNLRSTHGFCAIINQHVLILEKKLDLILKDQRVSFPPRLKLTCEELRQLVGWRSTTLDTADPNTNNDDSEEGHDDEDECDDGSE